MAAALLRLGRLGSIKCLLRESWGTQTTPFVAGLCTKADAPPKTTKKAKAKSKTIEAEERASLLAYKPAVAFPSKLSAIGFHPKDIVLGESESSAKDVTTDTVVTAAATAEHPPSASQSEVATSEDLTTGSSVADTAAAEAVVDKADISEVQTADDVTTASKQKKISDVEAEAQQDQKDTSSSSSSDSDSESESDSDDENSEIKPKTETAKSQGKKEKGKEVPVVTNKQVDGAKNEVNVKESKSVIAPSARFEESHESTKAVNKAKPDGVVTPSTEAVDLKETLIDPAPVLSSSMTEAIPEESVAVTVVSADEMVDTTTEVKTAPCENIVENEADIKANIPIQQTQQSVNVKTTAAVVPEVSPKDVANTIVEASSGVATKVPRVVVFEAVQGDVAKPKPEDASETVAKSVGATGIETALSEEDLKDPPQVPDGSVEFLAETEVVETSKEQAPEKASEPEPEPFDNTTYKNLEHHHYNMYTFADMDVEMSKYRLPQPSSGRPSPHH